MLAMAGATKMYGAALYRLRREDFGELRHHDGISPAWPIRYDEMEPYYTKAEQMYAADDERHRALERGTPAAGENTGVAPDRGGRADPALRLGCYGPDPAVQARWPHDPRGDPPHSSPALGMRKPEEESNDAARSGSQSDDSDQGNTLTSPHAPRMIVRRHDEREAALPTFPHHPGHHPRSGPRGSQLIGR